jgi:NAD(P)-dependent dehydrogenase (short-subunit alcohol dehydrogenase family)
LDTKVALVTGGGIGIGLAIARRFVAEGARVFVSGRRQDRLDEAVAPAGGDMTAIRGDVTNRNDLDRLFKAVQADAGRLDILVMASGVSEYSTIDAVSEEHFDKAFDVNVRGMVFAVQRAVPMMPPGGAIVLIGSIAGSIGTPATARTAPARRRSARSPAHGPPSRRPTASA